MDEDAVTKKNLADALEDAFTRVSQHILHEMSVRFGEVDTKLSSIDTRLTAQLNDMDRRLRRVDGNTITTMELLTRQSRWHEESDNAVHDVIKRQSEVERKLDELRGRIEKLENGEGKG